MFSVASVNYFDNILNVTYSDIYPLGVRQQVWDREKIIIIPNHYIFTKDEQENRNVDILRDYCTEQNIKYFYDIKDLGGFKVPLGTDSHTCTVGAFVQFATCIGNTDASFVLGTGKLLLKKGDPCGVEVDRSTQSKPPDKPINGNLVDIAVKKINMDQIKSEPSLMPCSFSEINKDSKKRNKSDSSEACNHKFGFGHCSSDSC
ncbi:hypothetical protein AgCh_026558 [Apium graveolens]